MKPAPLYVYRWVFVCLLLLLASCAQHTTREKPVDASLDGVPHKEFAQPRAGATAYKSDPFADFEKNLKHRRTSSRVSRRLRPYTGSYGSYPRSKDYYNTVWARLFSLYRLPEINNRRVRQELRMYLKRPDYMQRVQNRAEPYLFSIVQQIEYHRMPGEIALLPVVESAFQANAYSPAHASGIWQFIPSTGRNYGLKQNWWYDGRRDIHASTQAAIQYLKKLSHDFNGDWLLALAAYNSGEGRVMRAIKKNRRRHKPTDFWSLRLPRETRAYVPRLLAVAKLFKNARQYGIALKPIPDKPYYDIVRVGSQLDLALAAQLAGVSIEEIYRLNPGFNRWATAPNGPHRLLIPADRTQRFIKRLNGLSRNERLRWQTHRVASGESVADIARRYGISTAMIHQVNHVPGRRRIHTGKELTIPVPVKDLSYYTGYRKPGASRKKSRSVVARSKPRGHKIIHRVRTGDTLFLIAKKYAVSTRQVRSWNRMGRRTSVRKGEKLAIWTKKSKSGWVRVASRRSGRKVIHTVRRGDTLTNISKRYSVSTRQVRAWNKMGSRTLVRKGEKLAIWTKKKSPSRVASRPPGRRVVHVVRSGDTLTNIAKRYSVSTRQVRAWNKMGSRTSVRKGEKLAIWTKKSKSAAAGGNLRLVRYTVKKGDTLYGISRRFKVSVADLRKWNGSTIGKTLKHGQTIKVIAL